MKDNAKRFTYGAKRVCKSVLSETMEAFLYLLWISSLGVSQRLFTAYLGPQITAKAISNNLDRLYRKGFISKIKKGRNAFIQLKRSQPDMLLNEIEKLKRTNSTCKWDGVWRLLVYDIPEKERNKRDALRNYLKQFGFGKIQGSCWVSPYDLSAQLHEFCERERILRYICLYEGKFFAGKSIDILVEETWSLNAINAEYKEFIGLCRASAEKIKEKDINARNCCDIYLRTHAAFTRITRKDPFLPNNFLKAWHREEAEESFKEFSRFAAKKLLSGI
ncbi:MAG: PaaX family transcriptional regulator C-terminal domain-containing protein [Candidatus Omnitrophica bacterium]|nr:PaaX family transcriptional regulator C-terminal domain-containing protein [Candidatus Omnitrophota bacterium]